MRNKILMGGIAAALLSISSVGAFADSAPPVIIREGRVATIQENAAAAMDRIRVGVDVHQISPREARVLDHRLMAIDHQARRDRNAMTLAEYHGLLGRIDTIADTVKRGVG